MEKYVIERNVEFLWSQYCCSDTEEDTEIILTHLLNLLLSIARDEDSNVPFWRSNAKLIETILNDISCKIRRFIEANNDTESDDSFYTSNTNFNKSREPVLRSSSESSISDSETEETDEHLCLSGLCLLRKEIDRNLCQRENQNGNSFIKEGVTVNEIDLTSKESISLTKGNQSHWNSTKNHYEYDQNCPPNNLSSYIYYTSVKVDQDDCSFITAASRFFQNEALSTNGTITAEMSSAGTFQLSETNIRPDQVNKQLPRFEASLDILDKWNSEKRDMPYKDRTLFKEYKGRFAQISDYILSGNGARIIALLNENGFHKLCVKHCDLIELLCCLVPYIISDMLEDFSGNCKYRRTTNISPEQMFHEFMKQNHIEMDSKNAHKGSIHRKKYSSNVTSKMRMDSNGSSSSDENLTNCFESMQTELLGESEIKKWETDFSPELIGFQSGDTVSLNDCIQFIFSIVAEHLSTKSYGYRISRHVMCAEHLLQFAVDLLSKVNSMNFCNHELVHELLLVVCCGCWFFVSNLTFEKLKDMKVLESLAQLLSNFANYGKCDLNDSVLSKLQMKNIIFSSSLILCVMRTIYSVHQEDPANCLLSIRYILSLGITDTLRKCFWMIQADDEDEAEKLFDLIVSLIIHVKTWRSEMIHSKTCKLWYHLTCKYEKLSNHHDSSFGNSSCAMTLLAEDFKPNDECLISFFYQFAISCLRSCHVTTFLKSSLNLLAKAGFCCCLPLSRVISPLLDLAFASPHCVQSIVLSFIERSVFSGPNNFCWVANDSCDISYYRKATIKQIQLNNIFDFKYDLTFYYSHLLSVVNGHTIASHLAKIARLGIKAINILILVQLIQPSIIYFIREFHRVSKKNINLVSVNLAKCLWVLLVSGEDKKYVYEFVASMWTKIIQLCSPCLETNYCNTLFRYLIYFEQSLQREQELSSNIPNDVQSSEFEQATHNNKFFSDILINDLQKLHLCWQNYFNNDFNHSPTRIVDKQEINMYVISPVLKDIPQDFNCAVSILGDGTNCSDEVPDRGFALATPSDEFSPIGKKQIDERNEYLATLIDAPIEPIFENLVEMWEIAARMIRECEEFHLYRNDITLSSAKYFLNVTLHHLIDSKSGKNSDEFVIKFSATCRLLRSLLTVVIILSDDGDKDEILHEVLRLSKWKLINCIDLPKLVRVLKDCTCIEKTWVKAADLISKCKSYIVTSEPTELSDGPELDSELYSNDSSDDEIRLHHNRYIVSPQLANLALDLIGQFENSYDNSFLNQNSSEITLSDSCHQKKACHSNPGNSEINAINNNLIDTDPEVDTDLSMNNIEQIEVTRGEISDSDINLNCSDRTTNKINEANDSDNYLTLHKEHIYSVTKCIKILLSLCKISEDMCKRLYQAGFLTKVMEEFHGILTRNQPDYQEAIAIIVDLWYEVAQWEANKNDVCQIFSIFKSSNSPSDLLIRCLGRLVKTLGDEPFFYASFAKADNKACSMKNRIPPVKPVDSVIKQMVCSLHTSHLAEGLSSCLASGNIICPISRNSDWLSSNDGFSVFAWICFNDRQTVKRHNVRYTECMSSPSSPLLIRRRNFRHSRKSACSLPFQLKLYIDDFMHILSVGHLCVIFGIWLNTRKGLLCLRISNELGISHLYQDEFESRRLKQIGWHSISLSVPKHHRNTSITICIIIDGIEEIKLNMNMPGYRSKHQSLSNLLVIGQNEETRNKVWNTIGTPPFHFGNIFLFRSDLLTQETSLVLHHLSINNQSLFIENTSSELPISICIKPILLRLGVNISLLCKDLSPLILPLRMNLIASYFPENPYEYQCYSSQSPYFTDMSSVSYPICESLDPILFGDVYTSKNNNFESAILKMGGISQLIFLAARVIELKCNEVMISKTIGLILQLVQKVLYYRQQFHSLGGVRLLFRLFKDPFVPCGVIILKEILNSCISQPVICYQPRKQRYIVCPFTNGIISDLKVFDDLIDSWRYFWLPKDDSVENPECIDADGTTSLTNIGIILSSIRCLIAYDSPYRLFNLVMLRKMKMLQKLLSIFEEIIVEHRSVDGTCQPHLLVSVVSLLVCVGPHNTASRSPLLCIPSDADFDDSTGSFQERDLNKCGLLKPTVTMIELKYITQFLLLLNPDEETYISTETKHAFYLSQQQLIPESTRKGTTLMVNLGDGSHGLSSKFLETKSPGTSSSEPSFPLIVEKAVEAISSTYLNEEMDRKRKVRSKKLMSSSLLSFSIPEEAEWDVNEVNVLLESSTDTFTENESNLQTKTNILCHSVIISGLLEIVLEIVQALPDIVDSTALDYSCSIDFALTLCGNSCPNVKAAALRVFGILIRKLERDSLQIVLKRNVLHLLSHQLFRHGVITEDLLNAAFSLVLKAPFILDDIHDSTFKFRDHYPFKMFIPLLSLIPTSTYDIVLCHNTLSALYHILRKNEPHMLRFFYKTHFLDALILTLYRCIHTTDANVSDVTGASQSEIIIDDVAEMLCFFVNIFVAYPVNQSYVTFCEMESQINLLARSEIQRCGSTSKCVQSLLELESKILETAILRLTVVSLCFEPHVHSNSNFREPCSTESAFKKILHFCESGTLTLLSAQLEKEIFAEHSGMESENSPIQSTNQHDRKLYRTDEQIVDKLLTVFQRLSDNALDGNLLAGRFTDVLQKSVDLLFLIAPIMKSMEPNCIEKFAISLMEFLATSLQSVIKIKAYKMESSCSGRTIGFVNLLWMCQDILWNHFCHLITLLISPLMFEHTRAICIEALSPYLHLVQMACSDSQKHKLLLYKFGIFVHEFMNCSTNLDSNVSRICNDILTLLEEADITVLPPPQKGAEEWSVVEEEQSLWLEEVMRMASFIRQKNFSHDERLRTNYANFFSDVAVEGNRITMKVVELQNCRRKAAFSKMKKAQCRNIRNTHTWRNIIETMTHERADWHFPQYAPRGWSLDGTEGPNRIRRRLQRCHLNIDPKLFQPEFASLDDTNVSGSPLEFVLQDDESEAVLSQTVESINNDEILIYMGEAALITMTVHQNGELLISGKHIYFIGGECFSVDGAAMPGIVSKYWAAETIYEIHPRRYELRDCALEIFSTTNDSIMLAFDSQQERSKVIQILQKIYMPNLVEKMSISQATQLWRHGQITNFEYLTHLNKLAGRTLNDLMQYPVFPFVLSKYDSDQVDLSDSSIYRNLSKAVSVQNPEREEGFKDYYKDTEQMCPDGPYHYNSHYSNSVIVLYYMIRMPPFTQLFLKFQGKKFDAPDRTFYNLRSTWLLASAESNTAMRELIPEFYYMPEFFTNSQGFLLGFRQNGQEVNHIELPPWADADPRKFVFVHRAMLESSFVTQNLPIWIDLIFGYKQTGKAAIEAVNVFHPATYFGFDVEGSGDELTINARKTMIRTYGQTPRQLFTSSHPAAVITSYHYLQTADKDGKIFRNFKSIPLGIFAGSVGENGVHVTYYMTMPQNVSTMKMLPSGEVILMPQQTIACVFKMSQAFSIFYTISWRASDGVLRCKRQRNATILALTSFFSQNKVSCCASSGKQLWCGTKSGLIFVYFISPFEGKGDLVMNPLQLPLIAHSKAVSCLVISEEFKVVLSGGNDGTVIVWDYNKQCYVRSLNVGEDAIISKLAISPTLGDWVSVVHQQTTSTIRYYSINAEFLKKVETSAKVADVVFSSAPEGRSVNVFAAALHNGTIELYSTWTLESLRIISLQNNKEPLKSLFYTPNSSQLVVTTEGKRLYVCNSLLVKTKPLKFILVDPF